MRATQAPTSISVRCAAAAVACAGAAARPRRWNGGLVMTWSNGFAMQRAARSPATKSTALQQDCRRRSPGRVPAAPRRAPRPRRSPRGSAGRGIEPRHRCRHPRPEPLSLVGPARPPRAEPGQSPPDSRFAAGAAAADHRGSRPRCGPPRHGRSSRVAEAAWAKTRRAASRSSAATRSRRGNAPMLPSMLLTCASASTHAMPAAVSIASAQERWTRSLLRTSSTTWDTGMAVGKSGRRFAIAPCA